MNKRKILRNIGIGLIVAFVLIQLVPYGRAHANPPVVTTVTWDSPDTEALARRACYDCHSNETVWPLYSNVAPVSWLVQHDVEDGRQRLNFSNYVGTKESEHPDEMIKEINSGDMPPRIFLPTHPEARLTAAEQQQLIDGIRATFP
jgi:hypothetical protein